MNSIKSESLDQSFHPTEIISEGYLENCKEFQRESPKRKLILRKGIFYG